MPSIVETHPGANISPLAGKPAPKGMLVDLNRLEHDYFERLPDPSDPNQMVSFGTSGHRGSPFSGNFTMRKLVPGPVADFFQQWNES